LFFSAFFRPASQHRIRSTMVGLDQVLERCTVRFFGELLNTKWMVHSNRTSRFVRSLLFCGLKEIAI